jgi:hypothetical protein
MNADDFLIIAAACTLAFGIFCLGFAIAVTIIT